MKWRLVEQETHDAAMNMAIDHAIYESVANNRESPTIRFYKWRKNAISLGAYQTPKEINLELCRKHGVETVRRMTGGRAVFHDMADFTYSVIAPIRIFNYSIRKAYSDICYCIIDSLTELGIKSCLENKNDILVDGKKISGNAAKMMDKGVYLQHGTLIYDIDFGVMPLALNITPEAVMNKVTSLTEHKKASQKNAYETLRGNFIFGKDIEVQQLSEFEKMRAGELAQSKYNSIFMPVGSFMKSKGACYVERGG